MKTIGIISEYNPFHNGHLHHINEAKKQTGANNVVSVMSSNFTQRGEMSIFDKYERAKMAVKAGVNLVIELPFSYATMTSEDFSFGAVSILNSLNIIDFLSFGMEDIKKIDLINEITDILIKEDITYKTLLRKNLDDGLAFAVSRQKALEEIIGENLSFIKKSNNILAIDYIKSLKLLNSKIKICPVKRIKTSHNSKIANENFASASLIRELILSNDNLYEKYIPKCLITDYKKNIKTANTLKNYFDIIKAKILTEKPSELLKYTDMEIGLERRFFKKIMESDTLEEFVSKVSNKRHTKNRIRRILTHILIGLKEDDFSKNHICSYIKVLAFDEKGRKLIKEIKKNSDLKIFINFDKDVLSLNKEDENIINYEIVSSNIYHLSNKDKFLLDYKKTDLLIKK